MFSWSFPKSIEGMFSRWAIKRVCKFLLKKKLGKFILGDIDLNQLDVQLGAGTIQLSDLALNVDYINEKFGTAAVLVKEGSLGSLMVTMPWKDGGCRIEVDELEVVLVPRRLKVSADECVTFCQSKEGNNSSGHGFRTLDNETSNIWGASASVDVHEGVKTIAKMVKWLLTSFHVKIKKLIVAFDPLLEGENRNRLDRILVLRISEAECGTHIFEDASSSSLSAAHNFLGLSRLTNFINFKGAALELLHVDGLNHLSPPEFSTETTNGNWFLGYCSSGNTTTIISGEKGGFSGSLKFSIPWKNGSLDIRKVEANLLIDPLELRLEPSTIRCFIFMWDLFKCIGEDGEGPGHCKSSGGLSPPTSCMNPSDEGFVSNFSMEKEPVHTPQTEWHLISDWVSKTQEDRTEEPDFGASMDQFFECVDGLRNSQSAVGNSGMWNWTYSIFSAINAASNLASGSLQVPPEGQHVEANFNAAIAKVSLLLSLIDEDQKQSPKLKDDKANTDVHIHCLCAQFVDFSLILKIYPQEMNFEVVVQHIQLVDHLRTINDLEDKMMHVCHGNSESMIASIQKMQDGVQGALLTLRESKNDPGIDHNIDYYVDISLSAWEFNECCHMINGKYFCWKGSSVTLLKASGVSRCHVRVNSGSSGGLLMGPTSFSLNLPPIVCWVNFNLISMMVEFLKEIENCIETTRVENGFMPGSKTKGHGYSALGVRGKFSYPGSTNFPTKQVPEGKIFLPNARIILCFPLKGRNDYSSNTSFNQFIALDFISPTMGGKDVRSDKRTPLVSFDKGYDLITSFSLNLNIGNFYLYSISSDFTEIDRSGTHNKQKTSFSAVEIISVVSGTSHMSPVSMFWQEGPVTGPWIAKKAKLLASSEHGESEGKVLEKGSEFASATTVRDSKEFETHTRQEILATSDFVFHGRLPPVVINLDKCQFDNLCCLLNQVVEHFSCGVSESVKTGNEQCALQTSILLECQSLTISIAIEPVEDVRGSIRSELPGSWISLTLHVDKFELLSVSDIGGKSGTNFQWVAHGQGSLWGTLTEGLQREFLLISCSDSTMGRGDGKGSNVLSSRHSGSDIINLWDPEGNHSFTSINIRCATIVATGGRLDWFNTILSFFTPSGSEQACYDDPKKSCKSSFILNLVDVGLSYEPYIEKLTPNQGGGLRSSDLNAKVCKEELDVSCLLATSFLRLSNTSLADLAEGEYKIRLQDIGLLICIMPEPGLVGHAYSVEHLSKTGYVKVAREANIEALFRTNCRNGHAWELECADSHILLNTSHDTTFGLIRLAAQLQGLFAPDMQDYAVHLENRWNNVQHVREISNEMTEAGELSPSLSQSETSSHDMKSKIGNLMDEICEDVFQLDGSTDGQAKFFESHLCTLVNDTSLADCVASSSEEKNPEFIEEYFLSDLRPLSGLALKSQSSGINCCNTSAVGEDRIGNGGWYASTPLNILENHASEVKHANVHKAVEFDDSTQGPECVEVGKAEGRILLKNMNVSWRMNGGSDWSKNTSQTSVRTSPMDATTCLELALSEIGCEYDVYPDGEISASSLSLTIQDFCLYDRSDDAPWKLVLGNYHSKKHPRKSSSKAMKLNLEAVRPDPSIRIEENRLRISLLPMRLHLHQSQLDFLISFFGGKSSSADSSHSTLGLSKSGESSGKSGNLQARAINGEAFLTYFQKCDIWPLLVRVDYSPCRVDLTALRGGKYVELVNLVPWKGVELQLKHVQGIGLYGWSSIFETILGEWLEDISQNQVHKLLKGLPPIKSLVAVGSGAAKLVSLPVKNYKKDHRLLKGMQRGTFAFLRSISLEAIGLGVHLAAGAHEILLQAEYILASIPPSSRVGNSVKSNQPNDAQQGIQQAYRSISDGLGKSASALVQTPLKKYQRGAGMGSALASAVHSAPAAAIAPASAAARAVHCALLGFRNSLDPEHKKESVEKYLGRSPPQESMQ